MHDRSEVEAKPGLSEGVDSNVLLGAMNDGGEFAVPSLKDQLLAEVRANRSRKIAEIESREKSQEIPRSNGEPKTQEVPASLESFRPTLPVVSKARPDPSWTPEASVSPAAVATVPVNAPLDMSLPAMPDSGPSKPLVSSGLGWSSEDEVQQQEAIRTIEMLRRRAEKDSTAAGRMKDEPVDWSWKEAAREQVMCLEYELDGKEAALQLVEKHLEQRDAELQEVQQQLELLRAGDAAAEDAARIRSLRIELDEKERQLELKETHIQQLMTILQQHGSSLVGGEQDRLPSTFASFGASAYPTSSFR